jgi:hypothetical protein
VCTEFETQTGHRKRTHTEDEECPAKEMMFCAICDLFICDVCGGIEGSLLPRCPNRRLTKEEDDANYQHFLDFTGPFAP